MQIVALVILAVMWVAVLAPPFLRSRAENARGDTVENFNNQLGVLARTSPAGHRARPVRPRTKPSGPALAREAAKRRKRTVLYGLLGAAPTTLVLWMLIGQPFLWLHLTIDAMLVGFVGLLMRAQRLIAEREMKVAFLPHADAGAEPTALLAETAAR